MKIKNSVMYKFIFCLKGGLSFFFFLFFFGWFFFRLKKQLNSYIRKPRIFNNTGSCKLVVEWGLNLFKPSHLISM